MTIVSSANYSSMLATGAPFHHLLFNILDPPLLTLMSLNVSRVFNDLPDVQPLCALGGVLILNFLPLGFHSLTLKENSCTSLWRCFPSQTFPLFQSTPVSSIKPFWTFCSPFDCLSWVRPLHYLKTPHLYLAPLQVSSLYILPIP